MLEQLRKIIPAYYVDRFEGNDTKQLYRLSGSVRRELIYGSYRTFVKTLSEIHKEEKVKDKVILGEAAEDLVREMRQMVVDNRSS